MSDRPKQILAWAIETFGDVAADKSERAMRFIEEAIELVEACGLDRAIVQQLVHRAYSREGGSVAKEAGQAQLTLEALCACLSIDAHIEAGREFDRVRSLPRDHWKRRHDDKTAMGVTADATRAGAK